MGGKTFRFLVGFILGAALGALVRGVRGPSETRLSSDFSGGHAGATFKDAIRTGKVVARSVGGAVKRGEEIGKAG